MRNKLIFLLMPCITVFFAPDAFAQETVDEKFYDIEEYIKDGPIVYDVKITLMDVSDVDYANNVYTLSFWITLTSDEIDFSSIPPPPIDYVNGKIDQVDHTYFSHGNSYSEKVHGTFFSPMEFNNYPFLSLSLPIIVEPVKFESHEMRFVQQKSSSAVDSKLRLSGLTYTHTEEEVSDYIYADGDSFSRYVATYNFETPLLSSFMVGIFPIIIMGAVVMLSSLIKPTLEIRPEIVTATLIAAVFFHIIDVGESLPPLEYLTLEDKFMTVLYALIVFAMVEICMIHLINFTIYIINRWWRIITTFRILDTRG